MSAPYMPRRIWTLFNCRLLEAAGAASNVLPKAQLLTNKGARNKFLFHYFTRLAQPKCMTSRMPSLAAFPITPPSVGFEKRRTWVRLWLASDVSAVSEANGTTVPVSLDLRSSLSIQPIEGSRSRVRRTRSGMGIQSISA
jgi:hypothetical protein